MRGKGLGERPTSEICASLVPTVNRSESGFCQVSSLLRETHRGSERKVLQGCVVRR